MEYSYNFFFKILEFLWSNGLCGIPPGIPFFGIPIFNTLGRGFIDLLTVNINYLGSKKLIIIGITIFEYILISTKPICGIPPGIPFSGILKLPHKCVAKINLYVLF